MKTEVLEKLPIELLPGTLDRIFRRAVGVYDNLSFRPGQINLSTDPNTLDDYAENTFTPAITLGGAAVGVTYSTQLGTYTKVGRVVHFHLRIVLTSKGSSTGNIVITSLPFTCDNLGLFPTCNTSTNLLAVGITSPILCSVLPNTATIAVNKWATGSASALQDTDLNNNSLFNISGSYFV